jgi:hypothetical protein
VKLNNNGSITTQRDDFNFSIVNFPYLHVCSNIPASPVYGIRIHTCLTAYLIYKSFLDIQSVLDRGSLLTNRLISQGFQLSRLQADFRFMILTTILFTHTTSLWATCCLLCFIPIVRPFLLHWSWLRSVPLPWSGNRTLRGCVLSTGDAYSYMSPDSTSDTFRGMFTPILWFVFPIGLMRWITVPHLYHCIGNIIDIGEGYPGEWCVLWASWSWVEPFLSNH